MEGSPGDSHASPLGKSFPRVLRRAWKLSDPSTRCQRHSNALDRPSIHQKFSTVRGDYWLCAETGQMVRDSFPPKAEDLSGLYDQWWLDLLEKRPPSEKDIEESKEFLRGFEGYRRTGRLFEVGSGLGKLLRAAMECGWRAEGNELSPVAAAHAERFSGARVRVGAIEGVELEQGAYDVIILNNVFEHLDDPRGALLRLASGLRPGGALYLQTLDAQSLSLFFNPTGWTHFIDGHLHVPTLISLREYFRAAGLRVVRLETHGFSTKTCIKREKGSWLQRRGNKLVAALASRLKLGHRVRAVLERSTPH